MDVAPRLSFALLLVLQSAFAVGQAQQRVRMAPDEVHFPPDMDVVEVPFELYFNKILIPVSVNGSDPLKFVLDTGAPTPVLTDTAAATEIEFNIVGQVRAAGMGSGDPIPMSMASGVRLDIGAIEVEGNLVIAGGGSLPGSDWDGVIGGALFQNLVVEIDWDSRMIRLYQPDRYEYEGQGAIVRMELEPRRRIPVVPITISVDGSESEQLNFVLDTGAGHALSLEPDAFRHISKPDRSIETVLGWGVLGEVRGSVARIASAELGGQVLKDVVVSITSPEYMPRSPNEDPDYERHGNLGMGLLKRFKTIIDIPRKRVILEPTAAVDDPFDFSTVGVRIVPQKAGNDGVEIADVFPETPLARADVQTGDRIRSIDGVDVSTLTRDDIEDLLSRPPGTEIRLVLERGTEEFEVVVTSEHIL